MKGTALRIVSAAAMIALAGCWSGAAIYFEDARPVEEGCLTRGLTIDSCEVAIDDARLDLGIEPASVAAADVLIEDRCGPTRQLVCTRSVAFVLGVRFRLHDGEVRWTTIVCAPGDGRPYCRTDFSRPTDSADVEELIIDPATGRELWLGTGIIPVSEVVADPPLAAGPSDDVACPGGLECP